MTEASNHLDHGSEPDFGTGKKSFKTYLTGIILCIVLTLIPFGIVMHGKMARAAAFVTIMICALVQFFVQVTCFLRLNSNSEQGKLNIMAFLFTVVILVVLVGGSLWIMSNLNYNMMH